MVPKEIEVTTVDWEYYSQVVDNYNAAMNVVNVIKQRDTYEFTDEDWDTHIIFTDKIIDICVTDWSYKNSNSMSGWEVIWIIILIFLWLFVWGLFISNTFF